MPAYDKSEGGSAILKEIRDVLLGAPHAIRSTAERDDFPVEYRRRKRVEDVTAIRAMARDATTAFRAWADDKEAAAKAVLRADSVGSPAEETRKLRNEMEVDRLAARANSSGAARRFAQEYAAEAEQAYLDGDYERAVVLARASSTIHQDGAVSRVGEMAQGMIDIADPGKAAAMREVREVEWARKVFERDVLAGLSGLLMAAGDAARSIGDDPTALRREATHLSLAAKGLAYEMADRTVSPTGHVEVGPVETPRGALPGAPTGGYAGQPAATRL